MAKDKADTTPPPAPAGSARVVDQKYRAEPGETRFKVRSTSHRDAPFLYIAAADQAAAEACYLRESGVASAVARQRATAKPDEKVGEATLFVARLPD